MALLRYKDSQGNWITITSAQGEQGIQGIQGTQGDKGADGMSAYAAAVLGGYNGSASEFYDDLGAVEGLLAELEGI